METLSFAILVALTSGVVEVLKKIGAPKRFLPLTSLLVGLILTVVGNLTTLTPFTVITGVAVGLSASGSFDLVKYTLKKK